MTELYNIYCDESCHLEHDHQKAMVIGAVWCLKDKVKDINRRIREIKHRHNMSPRFEIKWTKVSPAKVQFYQDILDYFFDNDDLHFRVLIVPDKSSLNHEEFKQTHDDWYYKMFFDLLKVIIAPSNCYHIYLDYKDTKGNEKTTKLHQVLANAHYDFSRQMIDKIQLVRSEEVELIQLVDLLIGTVSYINRNLHGNRGKEILLNRMQTRSGYSLKRSTLLREDKVNIFRWHASWEEN